MKNTIQQSRRQVRTRKKLRLVSDRPRLTVYRSNKHIYAQIIDDASGKTLLSASEGLLKDTKGTKTEKAKMLGMMIGKLAKDKKITTVVFDKGSYTYHGRVKAVADGAREGGLVL